MHMIKVFFLLFTISFMNANIVNIPWGQQFDGDFTYYDDAGYGACGTYINAASDYLVALSYTWWTTPNPNYDPVCQNVCVEVRYNGRSVRVPIKDKCPSCNSNHLDLSKNAFQQLADLSVGHVYGAKWSFVGC